MLASAFSQYFALLAYSSLYYRIVCQRSSSKSVQKAKLAKRQNGKNSAGLKGKKNAQCRRRDWQNAKFVQKAKKEKSARNVRTKARYNDKVFKLKTWSHASFLIIFFLTDTTTNERIPPF